MGAGWLHEPARPVACGLPPSGPFYMGVMLVGHTVSHDLFSDGEFPGWIRMRNVPVKMVPTPDKILFIIRYFLKRVVLIGKKPCNLAAFFLSRKGGETTGHTKRRERPVRDYSLKIKGVLYREKTT